MDIPSEGQLCVNRFVLHDFEPSVNVICVICSFATLKRRDAWNRERLSALSMDDYGRQTLITCAQEVSSVYQRNPKPHSAGAS